jgi:hypothetical protein
LLVVHRAPGAADALDEYIAVLNRRLTPDNIAAGKPQISCAHGVTAAVFNPNGATRLRGASICIGAPLGPASNWHRPGAARPDGCYALLRSDQRRVELIADAGASRTVWFVSTPMVFIASTSQRAIVALLGRFEPNPAAATWMLSSGTLGPEAGWDSRIRQLLPGERIVLERGPWLLKHELTPVHFEASGETDQHYYARRLTETVESACSGYEFDASKWVFSLSGGIDSRTLLTLFHERAGIRTITWGCSTSPQQSWNDARIAAAVAAKLGVENRFFPTDLTDEPRDQLIQRFLVAGEGRISNISPFLDGFALWKTLRDEELDGIMRGDEAFGSRFVRNSYEARHTAKLTMLTDYFAPAHIEALGLAKQCIPPQLAQRQSETLATWRDRLYQQYRMPKFLAGLTDLKAAYVEVVNPLLADTILRCVRTLPDHLRTGKHLWREIARSRSMGIPFARRPAVLPLQSFLNDTPMLISMLTEMESRQVGDVLTSELRAHVCETIAAALRIDADHREKGRSPGPLALFAPESARNLARRWIAMKPVLEPMVFAFRAFIVSRMSSLLRSDSEALSADLRRAASL